MPCDGVIDTSPGALAAPGGAADDEVGMVVVVVVVVVGSVVVVVCADFAELVVVRWVPGGLGAVGPDGRTSVEAAGDATWRVKSESTSAEPATAAPTATATRTMATWRLDPSRGARPPRVPVLWR